MDFWGISQGYHRDITGISQAFHSAFTGISQRLKLVSTWISQGFHRDFTGVSQKEKGGGAGRRVYGRIRGYSSYSSWCSCHRRRRSFCSLFLSCCCSYSPIRNCREYSLIRFGDPEVVIFAYLTILAYWVWGSRGSHIRYKNSRQFFFRWSS